MRHSYSNYLRIGDLKSDMEEFQYFMELIFEESIEAFAYLDEATLYEVEDINTSGVVTVDSGFFAVYSGCVRSAYLNGLDLEYNFLKTENPYDSFADEGLVYSDLKPPSIKLDNLHILKSDLTKLRPKRAEKKTEILGAFSEESEIVTDEMWNHISCDSWSQTLNGKQGGIFKALYRSNGAMSLDQLRSAVGLELNESFATVFKTDRTEKLRTLVVRKGHNLFEMPISIKNRIRVKK